MWERINTERLCIRKFRESDWKDIYEYLSDPAVMKYETILSEAQCREWVNERLESNDFWAICLSDSDKMIGNLYLGRRGQQEWELGYMLNTRYQGMGYAQEAVSSLINQAFKNEGAHRICAICSPDNKASRRLLKRLGFRKEGHIRQNVSFISDECGNPVWQDTLFYGILADEWDTL